MLVIFDLDDTLIDTHSALMFARETVMRHFSHTPTAAALDRWQRAAQFFDSEDFALVLPLVIPGLRPERIDADEVRRMYWDCEIENVEFKAGAEDLLRCLEARAIRMALVTNGPREKQERKVKRLGLESYFTGAIIYADGVALPRKPNPAPVQQALRLCGAEPAAAFYVGDRLSDVVAARLSSVSPVVVKGPSLVIDPPASFSALDVETPLHTINHIADLLAIVDPSSASWLHRHDRPLAAGAS